MNIITSLDNNKVKSWSKLKSKKYRDQTGLFLVEGQHLVLEALKKAQVEEIILKEDTIFPVDVKKYYVTLDILKKISSMVSPPELLLLKN